MTRDNAVIGSDDAVYRRPAEASSPIAPPISSPPTVAQANSTSPRPHAIEPSRMPMTATLSSTSEVASLNSDSPSSTVTTRRGSPARRATATAATASGGATMAPSASAAANGISGITSCSTNATANAVTSTMPMASWVMARSSRRIAMTEDSTAAANSSGGSSTDSTSSGLT